MDLNKQKEYLENRTLVFNLSDAELINKIIEDNLYLSVIFEKYKDDFPKKLRKIFPAIDYPTLEDIFTESVCIFKDVILRFGLKLLKKKNSSIAGYLMGICKKRILNLKRMHIDRFSNIDFEHSNYEDFYNVDSDQIHNDKDYEELTSEQEHLYNQTLIQYEVLEMMKRAGGKCYSLILLSLSSEYNYRVSDLRELFNYKNNHTTISQKHKCLMRLEAMYNNFQLA